MFACCVLSLCALHSLTSVLLVCTQKQMAGYNTYGTVVVVCCPVIPVIHEYFQCSDYFLLFFLRDDMCKLSGMCLPYLS
jgi:hypothetical protein